MIAHATYGDMRAALARILANFEILSGDALGPSHATWRDVADFTKHELRELAWLLNLTLEGRCESPLVFPSPGEIMNELQNERETQST